MHAIESGTVSCFGSKQPQQRTTFGQIKPHNSTRSRRDGPCRDRIAQASRQVQASASSAVSSGADVDIDNAVAILKEAVTREGIPSALVTEALLKLDKKKLGNDSYAEIIGGGKDGRRWRLAYIIGPTVMKKINKGEKKTGFYFPVPAAQWWNKAEGTIINGFYLGQLLALAFKGPYEYKKNKLSFDFDTLRLRIGPKWFDFNLGTMIGKKDKVGPFFIFAYADDDLVVARGRAGGLGLWARTDADWDSKNGLRL